MVDEDDGGASPRRSSGQVSVVRAGVVVACFVVATILLLGPAGRLTAGTTTTTTRPTAPPPPVVKSKTTVQVANGTTVQGAAEAITHNLSVLGWDALTAEDVSPAPTASTQQTVTHVYFLPHQQPAAQQVAAELGVAPTNVSLRTHAVEAAVANAAHDDVVVILGTDKAH
jgi:hypothetical protein